MKILLAEDTAEAAEALALTLEHLGHQVVVCSNGKEAWELFDRNPHRLIVSDWRMPGFDGLELCRRVRKRAETPYTYFILLTGAETTSDNYTLAMAAGVDDFLSKPLNVDIIRVRLFVAERILEYTTEIRKLRGLVPICTYCHSIRDDEDYWHQVDAFIQEHIGSRCSHGICPRCFEEQMKQLTGDSKP